MTAETVVSDSRHLWNRFIERNMRRVLDLDLPEPPAQSDRTVAIIEPRREPHLEFALRNALRFLGPDWSVTWFHGSRNGDFARSLAARLGPVTLIDAGVADLGVAAYNALKKRPWIWERIPGEYVLWLEPDCLVCRSGIEDYLCYDYIGAPWPPAIAISPGCRVGNGGLSLRRRSAMLEISRRCNRDQGVLAPEDVFFVANMIMCNRADTGRFQLPDVHAAKTFCVESMWYPTPFGLHKSWKYIEPGPLQQLLSSIGYLRD